MLENGVEAVEAHSRIKRLVQVYKIPLTGLPQFIQLPVSRGNGLDDHDIPDVESIWSIEGRQRRFTRIENIPTHAPPPLKLYPYKSLPTYHKLTTGSELQPSRRLRKRTFDIYLREGMEYEMPFNETLHNLDAETCIRAEFIIIEHTTGRQRLMDCKKIDKGIMNCLALDIAWALGYKLSGIEWSW